MILQVVVGVEDVVLAVVLVLDGDVDCRESAAHRVAGRDAEPPTPVRVAAPREIDGGEVVVGLPVAGLEQRQDARPVAAGRGAEDSRVVAGVGAHVVRLRRLVEAGDHRGGVVEQLHEVRERVPEEPGDAHDDVDARPSELGERDGLDAGDASGLVVPARADAEERERLGHVVALRPHRRGAPDHEPDGLGHRAVLGDVAVDELVGESTPTSHASGDGNDFGSTE